MNANLFALLRSRFSTAPDRDFLVRPGHGAVTYGQIDDSSARMARVLRESGVGPSDRVVVQVTKSVEAVALYLAALRVGAVYVPLNPAYVAGEVEFFLTDAEPALFVHEHDDGGVPATVSAMSLDELDAVAAGSEPDGAVETRLADDLAAMLYTSGTTGRPKGAMLTHANLASNALTLHEIWGFRPGDVLLHALPIFHVHGLFVALHTAMLNASTVIFLDRFEVDTVLDHIPEASVMMGVPTFYARLLDDERLDAATCANMRLFTSGSAPMTPDLHQRFTARTGHEILERYGMTEAGMITSNPYRAERVPGTVGFALPGVEVRVCAEDGRVCDPGETGIVEVRGPNLFAGYWRLPDRTRDAHRPDGFFVTGDVGVIDPEGRLTLEGRASDMIIAGGFNIYPREVEQVLDGVAGVRESAVVGVPHADLGEVPLAIIVASEPGMLPVSAMADALAGALALFKHPRRFVEVPSLPRNAMGKVRKDVLRTEHAGVFGADH